MTAQVFLMILASISTSAVAQVTLKAGMSRPAVKAALVAGDHLALVAATALNPFIVGGFALYFLGALVWLLVLSRIDVSMAYPFVSIGFVLTAALAALFLGEAVGAHRLIGIALVAGGVYIIAHS